MLPAVPVTTDDLLAGAGGLAAAIAIGAFLGQSLTAFGAGPGPATAPRYRYRRFVRSRGDDSVIHLSGLGAEGTLVVLAGMVGMSVTCLLIGAIDGHYVRKAIARGERPDDF